MGHSINILTLRANLNFKWSIFFIATHYINYYFDYSYLYLSIRNYLYYLFRFRYIAYFNEFGWYLSSIKLNTSVNGFLNIFIFVYDYYYFKFYKKFFYMFFRLMKLRKIRFRKLFVKKKRFNRLKIVRRTIKHFFKKKFVIKPIYKPFIHIFRFFKYDLRKLAIKKKQEVKQSFYFQKKVNYYSNNVKYKNKNIGISTKYNHLKFLRNLKKLNRFFNFLIKKKLININIYNNFLKKKNNKFLIFFFFFKGFFFKKLNFKKVKLFWFIDLQYINKLFYFFKLSKFKRIYFSLYKYYKFFNLNKKKFIFIRYLFIKNKIFYLYKNILLYKNINVNFFKILLKFFVYKNINILKYFLFRLLNLYKFKFNIKVFINYINEFRYILMNLFFQNYNKLFFQFKKILNSKDFLNKNYFNFYIKRFLFINFFLEKLKKYIYIQYINNLKKKLKINLNLKVKYNSFLLKRIKNYTRNILEKFLHKKKIFIFLSKFLLFNKSFLFKKYSRNFLLINFKNSFFNKYTLNNKLKYFYFIKNFLIKHPVYLSKYPYKFNLISLKWFIFIKKLLKSLQKIKDLKLKKYKLYILKKKYKLYFLKKKYDIKKPISYKYLQKKIYNIKNYYNNKIYYNKFNKNKFFFKKKKFLKKRFKKKKKNIYIIKNFLKYFYKLFCINFRFFFFKRLIKKNLNKKIYINLKFFLFIFYVLYYRKFKKKFKKIIKKLKKRRKLIKFFFYKNKFIFKRKKRHLKSFLYLFGIFFKLILKYKKKKFKKIIKVCYYKLRNWFWFYIFYNTLRRFYYILYIPIKRFFFYKLKNFIYKLYKYNLLTSLKMKSFKIIPISFLTISGLLILLYFRWKFKRKFTFNQIVWPFMRRLQKTSRFFIKGFFFKISGRITKRQRASVFRYSFGQIKFSTYKVRLTYVFLPLITKYGKCGLKLWLNIRKKYIKRRFNKNFLIKKLL